MPPDGEPLPVPSVSPTDQLGLDLQMSSADLEDLSDELPPLVLVEERPVEPVHLGDESDSNNGGFLGVIPPGQPGSELPGTQPPVPDGLGLRPPGQGVMPPGQPGSDLPGTQPPVPEGLGLPPADQNIFPPGQPGAEPSGTEPPSLEGLIPPPSSQGVIPPGQPGADLSGTPPPPPEGLNPQTTDQSVMPIGQPGGPGGNGTPRPPVIGDLGEPLPDVIARPPIDAELVEPPPPPEGLEVPPIEDQSVIGEGQPGGPAPTDEATAPPVFGDRGEPLPDFITVPLADAELGEAPPIPEDLDVPPIEDQSVVGDGQPTGQGDTAPTSPTTLPDSPAVATPVSEPSSTPVTQPTTPVTVPVTTPVSEAVTQPTSTSTSTPVTPAIVTPSTPVTTPLTVPATTPVTTPTTPINTPVTTPTSGPIATPSTDPDRVPRPPEVGPNLPLPRPVNTNPVPPTIPETTPNSERPTVPTELTRFDDVRTSALLPDAIEAAYINRSGDYSPDDSDPANNPIEVPDLPWDLPTIPELKIPDLGAPLDSPADAPADSLHGDPVAELEWAQVQSENGYCVPVSVGMIVSELTGTKHGEVELVQKALDLGVLTASPATGSA